MTIKVKCADCGRHIGSFVRLNTAKKDIEIEIHGCYHTDIYDHIEELQAEIKRLKDLLKYAYDLPIDAGNFEEKNKWLLEVEQALKGINE